MKRNIKSLKGYAIGAVDGEIGKVDEFYFDDASWTIRYLIVETGNWLSGKKVLISPEAFQTPDWENKIFHLNLTKEQIKHSPDIDTDRPVTKQEEIKLSHHYPWKNYWEGGLWGGGMGTTGMVMSTPLIADDIMKDENVEDDIPSGPDTGDHHLRSTKKTIGYNISARDGFVGEIADFIVDDHTWKIDFVVVDTGNWFPGKKVLISPLWIKEIDWQMDAVTLDATVDSIKHSPEYDPHHPIDEDYSARLHDHYNDNNKVSL